MMIPLASVTFRAAPGPGMQQLPGKQRHAGVDDACEQDKRQAQQPGLDRNRQGSVRADELRHEGYEEQQALRVDPAGAHALQESPELGGRGVPARPPARR